MRRNKYEADTRDTCGNQNKIYEKSHELQNILRQMLSNQPLIPYFSLSSKPRLEEPLHQQLTQVVAHEEDYIDDNYKALKREYELINSY